MRIWIYCPRRSGIETAEKLAEALTEAGFQGEVWRRTERPPRNQGVIMLGWGSAFPDNWQRAEGCKWLNTGPKWDKRQEIAVLAGAGVNVPPTKSPAQMRNYNPPRGEEWIPRRRDHQKANDFRNPPAEPDFYTKKLDLLHEYRVHVFNGRSIRVGKQFPREDFPNPHQWVRNYHTGWVYLWGGPWRVRIPEGVRPAAIAAVAALRRDTGAVDLGVDREGRVWVLEVNTTPALEPNTIRIYVEKLREMANVR